MVHSTVRKGMNIATLRLERDSPSTLYTPVCFDKTHSQVLFTVDGEIRELSSRSACLSAGDLVEKPVLKGPHSVCVSPSHAI